MERKSYLCEIPDCNNLSSIRSTIKTGEFAGKKVCGICKAKNDGKAVKQFTEKNKEKRAKERVGLPEFFEQAIAELQYKPFCANCGCLINTWRYPINNIAHILSKRVYPSVMAHPQNRVFLCTEKDHPLDKLKSCHAKFDGDVPGRVGMKVFEEVKIRYARFEEWVVEWGSERMLFE